jgi:hypothetical protein
MNDVSRRHLHRTGRRSIPMSLAIWPLRRLPAFGKAIMRRCESQGRRRSIANITETDRASAYRPPEPTGRSFLRLALHIHILCHRRGRHLSRQVGYLRVGAPPTDWDANLATRAARSHGAARHKKTHDTSLGFTATRVPPNIASAPPPFWNSIPHRLLPSRSPSIPMAAGANAFWTPCSCARQAPRSSSVTPTTCEGGRTDPNPLMLWPLMHLFFPPPPMSWPA